MSFIAGRDHALALRIDTPLSRIALYSTQMRRLFLRNQSCKMIVTIVTDTLHSSLEPFYVVTMAFFSLVTTRLLVTVASPRYVSLLIVPTSTIRSNFSLVS